LPDFKRLYVCCAFVLHLKLSKNGKIAMPSININSSSPSDFKSGDFNFGLFAIPQSILLQMGTASVIMLVLAQKSATETLNALGKASEEVFRGDRLPILQFPDSGQNQEV
jgi:hypothetical protein